MQGCEHIPTHQTRLLVSGRKAQGCTHEQIADFLEISTETLAKHYAYEIKNGRALFMDDVHEALRKRISEGSDLLIKLCLTHTANPNGWRSADKQMEVDAIKDQTAALTKKADTDALTAQLRGHLAADAAIVAETSQDERS